MLKMSLAMTISYLIALFFGLQKTTRPVKNECSNKISKFITAIGFPDLPANLLLSVEC